ncbi:MAG: DUF937 domain-containing protein [Gemmatimonadota bacterium]|nr:DUF937 domain-containing protein [Gemmatimonadota bacterium]
MSLLDIVQQHLGPDQIQQISQHLGVDPATARNAINAALPMMVGGMAHTAQQPGGASAIQSAVDNHSAGGILGSLGGLGGLAGMLGGASNTGSGSGGGVGGILGSILGQHTDTVQNGVQTASGLDASKVKSLLAILAPIVMAALAQHAATQPSTSSGSSGGLGSILQQAATAAQQNNGGSSQVGGVLGQILGKL